ncbi:sensor domain-containing phosphodiesterase [Solicola sp. PLA-1-18]|uniref:sensor domain-containing phosphodiesterase n=1 Tax=Solicola sp. PLA-1-18 TaxID=3380532 RepID=UPI003B7D34B0
MDSLLRLVRLQLQMDVAFVSIIHGGQRAFRNVSVQEDEGLQVGQWDRCEDTYCQLVLDHKVPSVVPDTSDQPLLVAMSSTQDMRIGAHVGVPVLDRDGQVYGTLCAYSHRPRPDLGARDAHVLEVSAELLYELIEEEDRAQTHWSRSADLIDDLLVGAGASVIWQPVCELTTGGVVGHEALSRFDSGGPVAPHVVFEIAHSVAKGNDLELAMMGRALSAVRDDTSDVGINVSPQALCDPRLSGVVQDSGVDPTRLYLELTEHAPVADYGHLRSVLGVLRREGVRCAVDDLGAGFASLRHALELEAEVVKIDISLVRDLECSRRQRAIIAAIMTYAASTDTTVVAEGIETQRELDTLIDIGVPFGQGYLLGRPAA